MDEEQDPQIEEQDPQESREDAPQGGQPDYKAMYAKAVAESRKWEKRAKAAREKARKWDEASGGEESLEDRIATLEADKRALEDEKARSALVAKVSAATGVPEQIVASLNGTDEESLAAQAGAISEAYKPHTAPQAPEAGTFPRGSAADSAKTQFESALERAGF